MTTEELLAEKIRAEIDHEILMDLFESAGMDKKEISQYSENFWKNHELEMNRKMGIVSNEQIHKI